MTTIGWEQGTFTEEEALAEIADRGWYGYAVDRDPEDEELHWHEFAAVAFLISGTARIRVEDGSVLEFAPGTRAEAGIGWIHADVSGSPHRAVLGFSNNPEEWSQPINKPLAGRA